MWSEKAKESLIKEYGTNTNLIEHEIILKRDLKIA